MFRAELCKTCGKCLAKCMFNEYTYSEAIAERKALTEGRWAPILRNCAGCHACNEVCPQGANPYDLISRLQGVYSEMTKSRVWVDYVAKVDTERARVLSGPRPEPAEGVLLTCNSIEENPQVLDSILYADYANLPELRGPAYNCCCPLEFFGDEEGQKMRTQGFVDAIARFQPKEVVCFHDGCYSVLASRAPEYGVELPFRPVHLLEHLLRNLQKHKGRIRPMDMKIAYQRPCTSRVIPLKEPRLDEIVDEILQLIGCQRVARRYDRKKALCCGSLFRHRGLKDKSADAVSRNIDDSLEHEAEALVYLCPACFKSFSTSCKEHDLPLYHISALCQMAIGEKPATPPEAGQVSYGTDE